MFPASSMSQHEARQGVTFCPGGAFGAPRAAEASVPFLPRRGGSCLNSLFLSLMGSITSLTLGLLFL